MDIREDAVGNVTVVTPAGRIDSTTSADLDARLNAVEAAGRKRVVVDFSKVEYISSAGLRVLLTLAKRMRDKDGKLALCGMDQSVKQVFDLAGFTALFLVKNTRDDAVAFASA
jgi:stage II sporulation protein AA (anti-sigma F factor antagonist)